MKKFLKSLKSLIRYENSFDVHIEAIKNLYNEELTKRKTAEKNLQEFKDDLQHTKYINELTKTIKDLRRQVNHYGMPDYVWNKLEKYREEYEIPYWDKFIIEETSCCTVFKAVYCDKSFIEFI